MKGFLVALVLGAFVGLGSTADAALSPRLGGMAVYDDDLDVTWLADADANNGRMTWLDANAWAASLAVGGFTDWRLPTTADPDASCTDDAAGTNPSADAIGWNCTGSELGHLFYNELGGTAGISILSSGDPDLALFSNIQPFYWSSTQSVAKPDFAWIFEPVHDFQLHSGVQQTVAKGNIEWAWAVRTGDVGAVPIPAAAWLFGSALGLLGWMRRTRR